MNKAIITNGKCFNDCEDGFFATQGFALNDRVGHPEEVRLNGRLKDPGKIKVGSISKLVLPGSLTLFEMTATVMRHKIALL